MHSYKKLVKLKPIPLHSPKKAEKFFSSLAAAADTRSRKKTLPTCYIYPGGVLWNVKWEKGEYSFSTGCNKTGGGGTVKLWRMWYILVAFFKFSSRISRSAMYFPSGATHTISQSHKKQREEEQAVQLFAFLFFSSNQVDTHTGRPCFQILSIITGRKWREEMWKDMRSKEKKYKWRGRSPRLIGIYVRVRWKMILITFLLWKGKKVGRK